MFQKLKNIGPGALVAAAFIGPGTVTTATIAGASYGHTLLWAILFSIITTLLLQEMSARLGVVAQIGIGEGINSKFSSKYLRSLVVFLVISAIFIGNAAFEAGNISGAAMVFSEQFQLERFTINPLVLGISLLAFILLFSGSYQLIEKSLIVLVSVLGVVFLISAILLKPDITQLLIGLFIPKVPDGSLIVIMSLIGTTVVPYNLFLHASASKTKWSGPEDLEKSRVDTFFSIILGGIITICILVTASVAFHGSTEINQPSQLSLSLEPLLGEFSIIFIGLGFLAAGLSSAITAPLAAAYATTELLNWDQNLKSNKFRAVWIFILIIGVVFSTLGFKPTSVILFAQFTNGLLLPIIAIFLVWIMNDHKIMGNHINTKWINLLSILVILITCSLGIKSILSVFNSI